MDELMEKIIQNGFAIAVASYLLLRTDRRIETLTEEVNKLSNVLSNLWESRRNAA